MAQPPVNPNSPSDDARQDVSLSPEPGTSSAVAPQKGDPSGAEPPPPTNEISIRRYDTRVDQAPAADGDVLIRVTTAPAERSAASKLGQDFSDWFERVRRAISASISLIVHCLLIIALALWMLSAEEERRPLILATSWAEDEGDTTAQLEEFAPAVAMEDSDALESEIVENDDPFDESEIPSPIPAEPILGTLGFSGGGSTDDEVSEVLQGRAAGNRAALVLSEGGNEFSEEAVALGLKWLARHQHRDGHWSLNEFHKAGDCKGRCKDGGGDSDTAATALALLPFLGAGQTQLEGEYTEVVDKGLRWLVDAQEPNGDLQGPGIGRMYAHAQAAIALCEAYAMTRDQFLRDPAQKAIDFVVEAQHSAGGWRYRPRQPGDTSVLGWQIMALRSARMAYLEVPEKTFDMANRYLERAQTDNYGSRYGYIPGRRAEPAMTAEALLCRQYAGWRADEPGMVEGVDYLLRENPPDPNRPNIYYWYYGTQMMHHNGGQPWTLWNAIVRDAVISSQKKRGHEAGSWDPVGPHTSSGGRLYMTAISVCILEVYYRHLPLYRKMAVEP